MADSLNDMRKESTLEHALRNPPGQLPVTRIERAPVIFRRIEGHALAFTAEHVLVEWEKYGQWFCRWESVRYVARM